MNDKGVYIGGLIGVLLLLVLANQSLAALRFRSEMNEGLAALADGRDAVAQAAFTDALKLNNKATSAYMYRAMAEQRLGQLQPAMEDIERALAKCPNNVYARLCRATLFDKFGNQQAAIADCDAVLSARRDLLEAYRTRAEALNHCGRYDDAIRDCTTYLQTQKELPAKQRAAILSSRGYALFETGKYEAALHDYNDAIALDEKNSNLIASREIVRKKMSSADPRSANTERTDGARNGGDKTQHKDVH